MANRFSQAPSHGGGFRSGQPTLIVIHSLEAPARRGLAWDLANGWIKNAGVSPHSMTDPGETVDLLNLSTVGWHCGNGNQVGIGLEVTGYAAWSTSQWTNGDAFEALKLDAKRCAEVAKAKGIPIRWLSLQQIRNGERGMCTHADISATLGGTNHTDPGKGFPYSLFLQLVQQYAGGEVAPTPNPNPQPPTGPGGADPKDDDTMLARRDAQSGIDYVYDSRNFIQIKDKTHWDLLKGAGFITGEHGTAAPINTWDVEWIRGQVEAWGGRVDPDVKPGK